MYATENRDIKITKDGQFSIGVFDTPKENEYVIGMWELFIFFLGCIYIRCDKITGVATCAMAAAQF